MSKRDEFAVWFPLYLQSKNVSLYRLRTIIFGKGYKSGNKDKDDVNQDPSSLSTSKSFEAGENSTSEDETVESSSTPDKQEKEKKPGHGRMPHTVYQNCTEIRLSLQNLMMGDPCPHFCGGALGEYEDGVIVRIKGQNLAHIFRYTVEKLRCNLCAAIIEADIPPEIGDEKYDASFKTMIVLMKYYIGIPFYRQENFQKMLGFPLSDSVQWDLAEQVAGCCYASFNVIKAYAANGKVIQNDDTHVRILEVIKLIKAGAAGDRTGMYTTGIIAEYEGHHIGLFLNGRKHSGENLDDVLLFRGSEKEDIIQMCDALSANTPRAKTNLCNCLSHGFRKFEELVDFFPEECIPIMKMLSQVFKRDKEARGMDDQARLLYHQQHSKPVIDELEQYMKKLMDDRCVEPNSELGKSIKYMQKHWNKLTKFLSVPGAPIDNNTVERALKVAIRNRKSSLFYKTVYSAGVGGMLTSLIYTCHLNHVNPHDYLVALQVHQGKVITTPSKWLPWNYKESMKALGSDAIPQVHAPPMAA